MMRGWMVFAVVAEAVHAYGLRVGLTPTPPLRQPLRAAAVPQLPKLRLAPTIRMAVEEATAEEVAVVDVRLTPTDDQITAIFREYDTSKDGFIDVDELRAAMRSAGKPVSLERATEIMRLVDANGDGQISLQEFRQVFDLDSPEEMEDLASIRDLFIEEIRREVSGAQLNGPILVTVVLAGFLGLFWKYIVAISALYQSDVSWLPESLELMQTIPGNFLADYQNAVELAPLLTMACTSGFAYAVGDLVAQRVEGRWRPALLDLRRCARNALLGFFLHGPLVYGWIGVLEGPLAELVGGAGGEAGGWSTLLLKIFLDQTFFSALINILYASLNGILSDLSPAEAFARARQVLVPAMVSSWRFWPAVQLISYSPLIPVEFKLLWIDTMEILWVAYLSATVNSSPGETKASIPWGEGRIAERVPTSAVLDEPGDSDLLYVGPVALVGSLTGLAALSWPSLVIQLMTS
jgi:protein Mpv17